MSRLTISTKDGLVFSMIRQDNVQHDRALS